MRRKVSVFMLMFVSLVLYSRPPVWSQEYPTRPIEIVCRSTPGTTFDLMTRAVAEVGKKYISQPIVVTNKPGAAGSLAAAYVAAAKPDGYTILQSAQDFFAVTVHTLKLPFDPNDLVPLANFMSIRLGMAVKSDSPLQTFQDFVDYAKKHPRQLKCGHTGRGTPPHLSMLTITRQAGITLANFLPFNGSVQVMSALLGGHADIGSFVYGGATVEHLRAGNLRFLTVYANKRFKSLPDVPCIVELGYPKAWMPGHIGFYMHKDIPESIKAKLVEVFRKIYNDPATKAGIEKLNQEPLWGDPDFLRESIKRTAELEIPLIKELGQYKY